MVSMGRDLPKEFIDVHKRQRVVEAIAKLAHEHSGTDLTAAQIIAAARMSRRTFCELFEGKDDSERFACQEAARHIFDPVRKTVESPLPWLERLGEGLNTFLTTATDEPLLAELCLVHAIKIDGGGTGSCRNLSIETLVAVIQGGREAGRQARGTAYNEPPPQTEELLANGVISVVAMQIKRGEVMNLPSLRGELVILVAIPFFGPGEAGRYGRSLEAA